MKKGKVVKTLAMMSLAMTCVAVVPQTVKAATPANTDPEHAKTINIGDKLYEKYNDNDEQHENRYYKFTVPKDIGNKWVNIYVTNNSGSRARCYLYNDEQLQEELMYSNVLGLNDSDMFHTAIENSGHSQNMTKLKPGKTYYFKVGAWDDHHKDFKLSIDTVKDDNWGTIEKAPTIKCNTWNKGVLEYDDDMDEYCVKLPNDKKKHNFIVSSDKRIDVICEDSNGIEKNDNYLENETKTIYEETGRGQKVYIRVKCSQYEDYNQAVNYKIKVTSPAPEKKISKPKLTNYKKGTKLVKGKTISNAYVKVTVAGKAYKTVKSDAKGVFRVKTKKLKAKQKISVKVAKAGYKTTTWNNLKAVK